jgi:MoaA/NifB/PqqE/SkfB family radical SAM enzyme
MLYSLIFFSTEKRINKRGGSEDLNKLLFRDITLIINRKGDVPMAIDRKKLYRFPWSMTDNPSGWVEVTDICNLSCPDCYRQRLDGHRPLEDILADITACKKITNCDCMKISGGEPLAYPHIIEVIEFISKNGMKPLILTNGRNLDQSLVRAMEKAGLKRINFHIDSAQNRPGWEGKTEAELNELRQYYADLVGEFREVCCGFNVTVSRSNLNDIPDIVEWAMNNIHKVCHLALIALRGICISDNIVFYANGKKLEPNAIPNRFENPDEINITSEEILEVIHKRFPEIHPCAYVGGTTFPETNKYLVSINIGTKKHIYGTLGARSIELVQTLNHFAKGRYTTSSNGSQVGHKIFLISLFDREVKKSFIKFLKLSFKNPARFFDRIYAQPIVLEQPFELIEDEINLCDGCINMMIYQGHLIPSCRMDEYRLYDSPITPLKITRENLAGTLRGRT